jgi:hypothetical protein
VNAGVDRELTGALADAVTDPAPAKTAQVMAQLASLSGPGWLRLDESARRPYLRQSPLDKIADWQPLLSPGGTVPGVVAASMCRDGRVREVAVTDLARTPGPVAAAALAVRVADWVPQVGSAASAGLALRAGPEDTWAIISVLLALRQRRRGSQAVAGYLASPEGELPPTVGLWLLGSARSDRCGVAGPG